MNKRILILSAVASTFVTASDALAHLLLRNQQPKQVNGQPLELVPVKVTDSRDKSALNYKGKNLLPLTKKSVMIEDFRVSSSLARHLGIKLELNEKNAKEVQKALRKYSNERIAIVFNGRVLEAPEVRKLMQGDVLSFGLGSEKDLEEVIESMRI